MTIAYETHILEIKGGLTLRELSFSLLGYRLAPSSLEAGTECDHCRWCKYCPWT